MNVNNFNERLKARYAELRTNWFKSENLINRFVNYNNQFVKSGGALRELSQWGYMTREMNFNYEMQYISNWIISRLLYLDEQYGVYSGVQLEEIKDLNILYLPLTSDVLISNLDEGEMIQVFTESGQLILSQVATDYEVVINLSGYNSGVYVVKAGDKLGKIIK